MKILFDYQIFELQKFGGVSRYFVELLNHTNKEGIDWELPIRYSDNEQINNLEYFKGKLENKADPFKTFLGGLDFIGKWKLYNLYSKISSLPTPKNLNTILSIKSIIDGNFDIFHPTYYDDYFLPYLKNKPFILTIHDLIFEKYGKQYTLNDPSSINKKKLANKATMIIAVSENTKKDIIEVLGIDERKIEVIYLGNSLVANSHSDIMKEKLNIPEKYLLFVGNRANYKNFNLFIQAIAPLLINDKELNVICTGKEFDEEEVSRLSSLFIKGQVFHRYVDDESLACLYTYAIAFVFPTLYEGFGLPVLEAFSCGCPAILSNNSSLPEIGGDAAVYFNPKDEKSIFEAVKKVLQNNQLRENMKQKGREREKLFSWNITTKKTIKLYERVLSDSFTAI